MLSSKFKISCHDLHKCAAVPWSNLVQNHGYEEQLLSATLGNFGSEQTQPECTYLPFVLHASHWSADFVVSCAAEVVLYS